MTPDERARVMQLSPVQVAALTAYGEARNQIVMGIVAVLAVLRNRVADGRWGTQYASVCLAQKQFSCWNTGDPNLPTLLRLADALLAREAIAGNVVCDVCLYLANRLLLGEIGDPTGSATHYLTVSLWQEGRITWTYPPAVLSARIGAHVFFKHVK